MRLDAVNVPIAARGVIENSDLALALYRRHARVILTEVALVAGPQLALIWWGVASGALNLVASLLISVATTPLLSAWLIAGAGPFVFGEEFELGRSLRLVLRHARTLCAVYLLKRLLVALLGSCFVLPGFFIAARWSYVAEVAVLERLRGAEANRRHESLSKAMYGELFLQGLGVVAFGVALMAPLYLLFDVGLHLLFDLPTLSALSFRDPLWWEAMWHKLGHDPLVVCLVLATFWLVFPALRLCWFLCYLDSRIRGEGWDLELDFRREALRLGGAP